MDKSQVKPNSVDEYIAAFSPEVQEILTKVRNIMSGILPEAEQVISYGIPTFKINGKYVIYFAGYKKHISIYPIPDGNADFKQAITNFRKGPGTLQFRLDKPIPYALIEQVTKFRLEESRERVGA